MIQPSTAREFEFPLMPHPSHGWRIDWDGLLETFPSLCRLAGCPQDLIHHAEGDVLTHTRMVCEALVEMAEWRALPNQERSMVFVATLFHDIAKPACTKSENGRITSRGHAVKGAQDVRCLLWELFAEESSPEFIHWREGIVGLVRHHGLPLYFLERPNPQRALIEASMTARLDWIALLAEADVRGRHCQDRNELLGRVSLFREFAAEQNCLTEPYTFASDFSRFQYFRKPGLSPLVDLFDATKVDVTLMSGLPASGKDTWIERHSSEVPVISLDDLRVELDISPEEPQGTVAQEARDRAKVFLRRGEPFVWNATNTSRNARRPLIDLFADYGARVRIVYVETSMTERRRRNARRATPVPDAVVTRFYQRLETPDLTESHDLVTVAT